MKYIYAVSTKIILIILAIILFTNPDIFFPFLLLHDMIQAL